MSRPRSGSELESLRAQAIALERKIKEVAARERARKAAADVRRNLLAGELALAHMSAEPEGVFAATMLGLLNAGIRGLADRALFHLVPIPRDPQEHAGRGGDRSEGGT